MTFRDLEESHRHAITASQLLDGVTGLQERLEGMSADEHLQLIAAGGIRSVNENMRWTVLLAGAHALTAIALRDGEAPA